MIKKILRLFEKRKEIEKANESVGPDLERTEIKSKTRILDNKTDELKKNDKSDQPEKSKKNIIILSTIIVLFGSYMAYEELVLNKKNPEKKNKIPRKKIKKEVNTNVSTTTESEKLEEKIDINKNNPPNKNLDTEENLNNENQEELENQNEPSKINDIIVEEKNEEVETVSELKTDFQEVMTETEKQNNELELIKGEETENEGILSQITDKLNEKIKFVEVPDYERVGSYLVYNCIGKHWACIDFDSYTMCEQNFKWNQEKGSQVMCKTIGSYDSLNDCEDAQLYYININKETDFCR